MANEQSETHPYKSRYGAGWITAPNYLAENMCARFARSQGEDLPNLFWNDDGYWKKKYLLQILHATSLLKEFPMQIILTALRHPDANRVYSLGLKSVLAPLMKREKKKLDLQEKIIMQGKIDGEEPAELPKVDTTQKPRPAFTNKANPLKNLRGLDDG